MVEVKGPQGRLSAHQIVFRGEWTFAGGEYVVARSVDDVAHLCDVLEFAER